MTSGIWFERLSFSLTLIVTGEYFSECTEMAQQVLEVECVGGGFFVGFFGGVVVRVWLLDFSNTDTKSSSHKTNSQRC